MKILICRRGGRGGKHPSCPFLRGARGQECPLNGMIYFSNNFQFDGMKPMNFNPLSRVIIAACIGHTKICEREHHLHHLEIFDSISSQSKECGRKTFSARRAQIHQIFGLFPPSLVWSALAFPFDPLALPSLRRPCVSNSLESLIK